MRSVGLILVAFAISAIVDRSVGKHIASPGLGKSAQATITSISPSQGPIAGGTQVTLTGSGFSGTTLSLDGVAITPQSTSDTQIVFITPPRDNGIASFKLSGNGPNAYAEFLYLPPALNTLPPGYITTVIGIGLFEGDGRQATNATGEAGGLAIAPDGSIFLDDPNNQVIRRIGSNGVIERYAGTGPNGGPIVDGIPAIQAILSHPRGVEVDSSGNVYLADSLGLNSIRKIDANTTIISTIAGGATPGFSGDGGQASQARLNDPLKLAFDGAGNLYVLDWGNVRIRKIATNGIITTIAGNGVVGFSGDGGPATGASFDIGNDDGGGLAADSNGNVFLAANGRIRRIDGASGMITTFIKGILDARAVATDSNNNVYVGSNNYTSPGGRILKLSPAGQILHAWGLGQGFSNDGVLAASAPFEFVQAIRIDSSGNVIFVEYGSTRIRRINLSTDILDTIAGIGPHIIGETGPALATVLADPGADIALLPDGEMLTAEGGNLLVRRMDLQGNMSPFAGNGLLEFSPTPPVAPALQSHLYPNGIAVAPNGDVFVANNDGANVVRVDTQGDLYAVTSNSGGFAGDGGPASQAALNTPAQVAIDSAGNVFIADTNNNRIRRIDAQTTIISTVAGNGSATDCGDGGPATLACVNTPYGVAVDTDGTLYIGEANECVRKVDPQGVISTLRPRTVLPGNASWLAINSAHNVFGCPFACRIEPNGHTYCPPFAGYGIKGIGDGGPVNQAKYGNGVGGIAVDGEGNLYFSDEPLFRIRAIRFGAVLAEPGSKVTATNGLSQSAPAGTTFPVALQITLRSPVGTLENGIRVDFSAPASGPSCRFSNGYSTYSTLTDINGHATAICTANSQVGSYNVSATPLTLGQSASFSMTNGPALPINRQLLNISTRMRVLNGDNVLIGGFIVTGSNPKNVIVRGLGPSVPVNGALADPTLELHDANTTLAFNDNWRDTQQVEIQATGIPPSNDLESAIVATLPANNASYTAILRGKNNTTGVGLVEVYDLAQTANSQLANISTRGFVDVGDNVMIGGFIAGPSGSGSAKVLIRAIGPSLSNAGVSNALQDPTLELHNGNGDVVIANDNWRDTQQAEIQATGIPPTEDRESAVVQTIVPGNYTAIMAGKAGTTGVGLIEVYNLR
jgi:streptogramin lyase